MKKNLWIVALFVAFALIFAGCASSGGSGGSASAKAPDIMPDMDEAPPAGDYTYSQIVDFELGEWDGRKVREFTQYIDVVNSAKEGSYVRISMTGVKEENYGWGVGDFATYVENPQTGKWDPSRIIFIAGQETASNAFIKIEDIRAEMGTYLENISIQYFDVFKGKIVGIRVYLAD